MATPEFTPVNVRGLTPAQIQAIEGTEVEMVTETSTSTGLEDVAQDSIIKWSVRDLNHTPGSPPRMHSPLDGHQVPLFKDRWTFMDARLAIRFLRDPGFEVRDENKVLRRSLTDVGPKVGDEVKRLQLGEVVAKLEDLTADALYAQASIYPGSERLSPKAPRDGLIAFIRMAQRMQMNRRPGVDSRGASRANAINDPTIQGGPVTDADIEALIPVSNFDEDLARMGLGGDKIN